MNEKTPPLITFTSDFGVQTQGIGQMEAVAFSIAPHARIIHLMHGLPEFSVAAAARTMETVQYIPVGHHVCVCDPGVGTSRKGLVIETVRGDFFIGPDNGVFLPAARILGGIARVHELQNPRYMRHPVSPIFHGRDIFAPAAAFLACGVPIDDFGANVDPASLMEAPYDEAVAGGGLVNAKVIQINHFGSIHLNITHEQWDSLNISKGENVSFCVPGSKEMFLRAGETFGDVPEGEPVIMKDDYGRVEIAVNMGSFIKEYPLQIGADIQLKIPR